MDDDPAIMKLRVPISVQFIPQPDITAYELARCLPYFYGQPIFNADDLGDLSRHFKVIK